VSVSTKPSTSFKGEKAMTQGFLEQILCAQPNVFREYVGYTNAEETVQSNDGDFIWSRKTIELMANDFGVKVLIPVGATKDVVVWLLKRMLPFIEASGVDPDNIDEADFF
jgi:hypothetical protein